VAADGIHQSMIRAAMTSPACLAVAPLQDVLGLGSEARMNTPSQPEGNWTWRLAPGALTSEVSKGMAHLVEVTDRLPQAIALGPAEEFAA
jgi:4-alpha-glucanotransferase